MKTIQQGEIKRNGRNQPIVAGIVYPRVTTMIGRGEDKSGLLNWSLTTGVNGVYNSPDLQAAWATLDPDDWKTKKQLVEQIKARAGAESKATIGTAIHAVTESVDAGEDISGFPEVIQQDAMAYKRMIDEHRFAPVVAEVFVVNEELGVAGTPDRLFERDGKLFVGDLKTSANANSVNYALSSWSAQVAVYARSRPVVNDEIVDWETLGFEAPRIDTGVVIHVHQGKGIGSAYRLDLHAGWERAKAAAFLYNQDKEFRQVAKTAKIVTQKA